MARKRIYESAAARVAAYRERHALVTLSVDIPRDVAEGFLAYLKFKDLTKSEVICKLIQSQLLRKR